MGLIRAATGAFGGVMADQWKEFFYCDALPTSVLMRKGQKNVTSRNQNTKGEDNIITDGSGIAVADGQCMLILEQGKVVEFCAEPGQFTYDASTEPSLFTGNLFESIGNTFKAVGRRFTYGGSTGKDQRVYYINTKEILDNKFGTPSPVPFRVVDKNIGLDVDISVRCNGIFTFKIVDPLLFYTNVCGNVQNEYKLESIISTLKSEFLNQLGPAFSTISEMEVRPNQIPSKNVEICKSLKQILTVDWTEMRGLEIASVSFNSVTIPKEDEDMIKELQRTAVLRNPTMAAATLVGAQSEAMKSAAKNEAGAMMGFMGMGMAQQAGGLNAQNLYAMGAQQEAAAPVANAPTSSNENSWKCSCGTDNTSKFCQNCGLKQPEAKNAGSWKCSCGTDNTSKFCQNCGAKQPENNSWVCSCGVSNTSKFCKDCGQPKPSVAKTFRCDKCGWEPEDAKNPPKFCPECGDIFNDDDAK